MGLEERSGNKTLLKLLLEKSTEVLTQSKVNETQIKILHDALDLNTNQLILLKQQLSLITGVDL